MKNKIEEAVSTRFYKLVVLCFLVMTVAACGKKLSFSSSTVVPGAESSIKIKRDKNKNYAIRIKINQLTEARNLTPSKNTYVAWIETNQGIKNIGQLRSSSGLFSKALKASLETVTSFKPTKVFVTAEDDARTQYPGMQLVLTTRSF